MKRSFIMVHPLQKALQYISRDQDCGDFKVCSYSGRGMYGKTCLAITGDRIDLLAIGFTIGSGYNDEVDPSDLVGAREDSMGLRVVIYWPNIPFEATDETDEEDA
jgi:hypothetical protein